MGIRFLCPNGHRLNVKSSLAGRRGVCPHCGEKFPIPLTSTIGTHKGKKDVPDRPATHELDQRIGVSPPREAERTEAVVAILPPQTFPPALDALLRGSKGQTWYVRHPHGGQYGPADSETMRHWFVEGRVPPDAMIWQPAWDQWRRLGDLGHETASLTSKVLKSTAAKELESRVSTTVPAAIRRKQKQTWTAIILLSLASLVILIGLVVVLSSS